MSTSIKLYSYVEDDNILSNEICCCFGCEHEISTNGVRDGCAMLLNINAETYNYEYTLIILFNLGPLIHSCNNIH